VLNEVRHEYDSNQQLSKLYQSHTGAVNISITPSLQYSYAGIANSFRTTSMVYPNGKALSYNYDARNNLTAINENSVPIVSYIYSGNGNIMQTMYNEPSISLTYANGGLDRFGRVVNHLWMKDNQPPVHIIHGYDFAGNRTHRHDALNPTHSELYTYDSINQIKNLNRGTLSQNNTAITNSNFTESWDFDKTGNWAQYNRAGIVENRTHNAANEIQGIVAHDKNGNMTVMPGHKAKYDAWNRMVEVRDTQDNLIATYDYNGLNQHIRKTVGSVVTESFFNERWQELESTTAGQLTTYVWCLRYIDDLIYRERGEEKLYSLADPNWNVVALTDTSGNIVERMRYDAFGKVTWMDANFTAKANSDYNWNRTFTGQVLDSETGLMLYRNRIYRTNFGRFSDC
jgi:YD repeat-containing protein